MQDQPAQPPRNGAGESKGGGGKRAQWNGAVLFARRTVLVSMQACKRRGMVSKEDGTGICNDILMDPAGLG
jgi:hypothetical protein